jgi:preprotein translocase subunit SecF
LVQVKFTKPVDIAVVRSGLEAMGFKDANVQKFGEADEFLVRVEKASENLDEISKSIQSSIRERFKDQGPEIRRVELVGPKVGKDLKTKALWATVLSFLAILIYVASGFMFAYGLRSWPPARYHHLRRDLDPA